MSEEIELQVTRRKLFLLVGLAASFRGARYDPNGVKC